MLWCEHHGEPLEQSPLPRRTDRSKCDRRGALRLDGVRRWREQKVATEHAEHRRLTARSRPLQLPQPACSRPPHATHRAVVAIDGLHLFDGSAQRTVDTPCLVDRDCAQVGDDFHDEEYARVVCGLHQLVAQHPRLNSKHSSALFSHQPFEVVNAAHLDMEGAEPHHLIPCALGAGGTEGAFHLGRTDGLEASDGHARLHRRTVGGLEMG
mmetsp:Transcript_31767/g.73970  ORF Transcript_31767/g.73970 Transcript_31767/m.73970 type:complete len:210 (+) Transcript_31767:549-1178(+)